MLLFSFLENNFKVPGNVNLDHNLKRQLSITLLYLKWTTHKERLNSTGNSAQCYAAVWMGDGFGEEWTHVYKRLSPFAAHLRLSQHCNQLHSNTK